MKNTVTPFFAYALTAVGAMLFSLVVVRLHDLTTFGAFSYLFAVIQLSVLISRRGLMVSVARYAAKKEALSRFQGLVFANSVIFKTSSVVTFIASLYFVADFFIRGSSTYFITGLLLSATITPNALLVVFSGYVKGTGKAARSSFFTNGAVYYLVIPFVYLLSFFTLEPLLSVALAYTFSFYLYAIIALSPVIRLYINRSRDRKRTALLSQEILVPANIMLQTNIATSFVPVLSVWIVGLLLSVEAVGVYKILQQLIALTTYFSSVVATVVGRDLSRNFSAVDKTALICVSRKTSRLVFAGLPTLLLSATAYWFLLGVDLSYLKNGVVVVFALAVVINLLFGMGGAFLNWTSYESDVRIVSFAFLLLNVMLFPLISIVYGLNGAVMVLSVLVMGQTLTLYSVMRFRLGVNYLFSLFFGR